MFTKYKLLIALIIIAPLFVFASYKAISLTIQKRQFAEMLGKAQEEIAKEQGFHEAALNNLKAKDIENEKLRESLTKMEEAGASVITKTKVVTETTEVVVEKEIEVEGKKITIPCQLDLSASVHLAAAETMSKRIFWSGFVRIYDGTSMIAELQPDFSKSEFQFRREYVLGQKKKRFGWQLGMGFVYTGNEFAPAIYFGYGISF